MRKSKGKQPKYCSGNNLSGLRAAMFLSTKQSSNVISRFRIVPETDSNKNVHGCGRGKNDEWRQFVRCKRVSHTDKGSSTHPVCSSIFDSKLDYKYNSSTSPVKTRSGRIRRMVGCARPTWGIVALPCHFIHRSSRLPYLGKPRPTLLLHQRSLIHWLPLSLSHRTVVVITNHGM